MFRRVILVNKVLKPHHIFFASASNKPVPLITCKNTKFNLMINRNEGGIVKSNKKNTEQIELASKGWQHYKSKGDHFTIHSSRVVTESFKDSTKIEDLELDEQLLKNMHEKHDITMLTKLQKEAIDKILDRRHVLIAAETGCGKTHAYLLPIIQQVIKEKSMNRQSERQFNTPVVLILTPGRELAHQIGKFTEELVDGLDISVKVVVGGKTKQKMLNPSFEDIDVLIGSIGAISKLTTTGIYRMSEVKHVVLDEVDTIIDDSFNEKVCYFLQRFPFHSTTQLVLASATMPTNTDAAFRDLIDTETLENVVSDDLHKILPFVSQKFLRINKGDRPERLVRIVKGEIDKKRPVIVFSNQSKTCDYVSILLQENGIDCLNINGDMMMQIREGRFEKFQNGECNVISTTDCISRGLNTVRARHIVNFDFPLHVSDYIHRCGRIGRLGSNANCYITNFISGLRELDLVRKIEMSARTNLILENVDANISKIINTKIEKEIKKHEHLETKQLANSAM